MAVPHRTAPAAWWTSAIEYSDLAPALRRPWTGRSAQVLAEVIVAVRPAIAAVDREVGAGLAAAADLGADARTLLDVGWVREGTLDPAEQREAFEALRRRRWVRRLGDGLTWGAGRMWSLTDGILRGDGEDLTAAVFEAWTGTPASPRTPSPDPVAELVFESNPLLPEAEVDQDELNELNPPELWFWHHDLDEDELVQPRRDRAAAVRGGVRRGRSANGGEPSWRIRRPGSPTRSRCCRTCARRW